MRLQKHQKMEQYQRQDDERLVWRWRFIITAAAAAAAATTLVVVFFFLLSSSSSSSSMFRPLLLQTSRTSLAADPTFRILYIVTSSKMERLLDVVVPVLRDGIDDILSSHSNFHHVDVYLILGYTLNDNDNSINADDLPNNYAYLRSQLPPTVGLQIWNSATPLYYELSTQQQHTTDRRHSNPPDQRVLYLSDMPRTLARQHRYVIKDKLPYYDFFVVLEDDMLVRAAHIQAHIQFRSAVQHRIHTMKAQQQGQYQQQQYQQQTQTQEEPQHIQGRNGGGGAHPWWEDDLSIEQWQRLQLGWIRVEVMQQDRDTMVAPPLLLSSSSSTTTTQRHIDEGHHDVDSAVSVACCCHSNGRGGTPLVPPNPTTADQLVLWETGIAGLSLRKLPPYNETLPSPSFFRLRGAKAMSSSSSSSLLSFSKSSTIGWVALLGPPSTLIDAATVPKQPRHSTKTIAGYWSGSHGALSPDFHKPPSSRANHFFANPAGWMATQGEVFQWHTTLCKQNTFLPPLDHPSGGVLTHDGMGYATDYVEYWSGGMQLYGPTCQLQRAVSLDPEAYFSHHLMYHTANNKQHQLSSKRFVTVTTLLEQLHAVRRAAEKHGQEVVHDSR